MYKEIGRLFTIAIENNASKEKITSKATRPYHLKKDYRCANGKDEDKRDAVVVICAVDIEFKNAKEAFKITDKKAETDKEDEYGFRYFKCTYESLDIFLIKASDKGMVSAASVAASSIIAFRPKLVAMTGICAGRKGKTELGDIIIAKQTFDYEAGRIEKEIRRLRPDPITIPKGLKSAIQYMELKFDSIIDNIPHAKRKNAENLQLNVHFKHIASGSSVLCNPKLFEDLTKQQDDVYGVDMEAYGIAYAANFLNTAWIVIKSVQDYADEHKSDIEESYRACSAYSSVLILQELLKSDDFMQSI